MYSLNMEGGYSTEELIGLSIKIEIAPYISCKCFISTFCSAKLDINFETTKFICLFTYFISSYNMNFNIMSRIC